MEIFKKFLNLFKKKQKDFEKENGELDDEIPVPNPNPNPVPDPNPQPL